MAVRLRLLAKKLHVFLFGRETPTLLVAAGQLSMHYERWAKLGVAPRSTGSEAAEQGVGIRHRLQGHLNCMLGLLGQVKVNRANAALARIQLL